MGLSEKMNLGNNNSHAFCPILFLLRAEQPLQATILSLHGANVQENPSPYLVRPKREGNYSLMEVFPEWISANE